MLRDGDRIVWTAEGEDGSTYAALFNAGEAEDEAAVSLGDLDLNKSCRIRDLWKRKDFGTANLELRYRLALYSSLLLKLS